jgi:hypothetical protein
MAKQNNEGFTKMNRLLAPHNFFELAGAYIILEINVEPFEPLIKLIFIKVNSRFNCDSLNEPAI